MEGAYGLPGRQPDHSNFVVRLKTTLTIITLMDDGIRSLSIYLSLIFWVDPIPFTCAKKTVADAKAQKNHGVTIAVVRGTVSLSALSIIGSGAGRRAGWDGPLPVCIPLRGFAGTRQQMTAQITRKAAPERGSVGPWEVFAGCFRGI